MPYTWITLFCSLVLSATVAVSDAGKPQDSAYLSAEQLCSFPTSIDEAEDLPAPIPFAADMATIVADSGGPSQQGPLVVKKTVYLCSNPIRAPPALV